jgi:hypothetical protein
MATTREPRCQDCQAAITWAQDPEGNWTKLGDEIVEYDAPGAHLLITTGSGRNTHRAAVPFLERVAQVAAARGWSEAKAGAFVANAHTAHLRHFCPQGRRRRAEESAQNTEEPNA